VLRAIDKLDRLGTDGVEQLLGEGRKDESGDVTKGAGLNSKQIKLVLDFLFARELQHFEPFSQSDWLVPDDEQLTEGGWPYSNINTLTGLSAFFEESPTGTQAIEELLAIFKLLPSIGYGSKRIRFDPTVVRGLEYYTGPVLEAELTFEARNEDAQLIRFGSVGGGGRYDGLVSRFKGTQIPATGFSIGVSRLYAALQALGKLETDAVSAPVVVLAMDKDRPGDYARMARRLREAGIRAETYLGTSGMKAQMKYADKRGSPCVVIQGGDEKARGEVTIKDMILGEQLSQEIADNQEWREGRPAQFSVKEDELVEAVRSVLARHSTTVS
jgi:histidyl-tRNA synthetase